MDKSVNQDINTEEKDEDMNREKKEKAKKSDIQAVSGFSGLKRYLEEAYDKPAEEIELPDIEEPSLGLGFQYEFISEPESASGMEEEPAAYENPDSEMELKLKENLNDALNTLGDHMKLFDLSLEDMKNWKL